MSAAEKLEVIKTCNNCGKEHYYVPGSARLGEQGVFWECDCKSTLFLPLNKKAEVENE